MMRFSNIFLCTGLFVLTACGGTIIPTDPVKEMKEKFASKLAYTIILADMDLVEETYFHKYKILELMPDKTVAMTTTDWEEISDDFFLLHETNLGMEVLSKKADGTLNNLVTPPGFTNFIGDTTFGFWYVENEQMFWKFHPKHEPINTFLALNGIKVLRSEFDEFQEKYLFNRAFYGEITGKDSTKYGTYSRYSFMRWPDFYTRKALKKNFEKEKYSTVYSDDRGGGGTGK